MPLKIKLLDYQGGPVNPDKETLAQLERLVGRDQVELTGDGPEILIFLSGGSEQYARQLVESGKHYLLIGSRHGNSYASATEVKAWMNGAGISSMLLDEEDEATPLVVESYRKAKESLASLKGKRIGLLGKVSGWLIASGIPAPLLLEKFGLERMDIDWSELLHFSDVATSQPFLDYFSGCVHPNLDETARVSELLSRTILERKLDAITVECFPLVKENGVTACLPLARFNDMGFPAGCEGDLTALVGMMLGRELTGTVPWIANINKVSNEGCLFSHCTIAPGLVDDMTIPTHYETGVGTAIQGRFRNDRVTVFRLDSSISRAFIATGLVTGRPQLKSACRTQIEVQLAQREVTLLREDPLGNHHLIFPGDCTGLLRMACWLAGVTVL